MSSSVASSYVKSKSGAFTVFTVTPGQHPQQKDLPIGTPLAGLGELLFGKKENHAQGAPPASKMILGKQHPYYRPVAIRVRPGLLELPKDLLNLYGRSEIPGEDIHRLVTKNYIVDDLGYGKVYASNNAAFNYGRDVRFSIAKEIGWAVDAEAGGRAYILSFGLNEVTANGLMSDISRVLNG